MIITETGLVAAAAAQTAGPARVRDRLVVRPRAGLSRGDIDAVLRGAGVTRHRHLKRTGVIVLRVNEDIAPAVTRRLRGAGVFTSVDSDYIIEAATIPNDPYYGSQWALSRIGATWAWAVSTGSADVPVAVLDTGVDASHPDLMGQLQAGYDFINHDSDPTDDHGHGTRMAGVIAAVRNNAAGIAGVAPGASIIPVKVLDANGGGSYSTVAEGIMYAVDRGARVINLSVQGTAPSDLLQSAVDYAAARGVVVVAAAGNYGTSDPVYPAALAGVIGVGATDSNEQVATFSSHGSWVAVSAPGVDIYTTMLGGGYGYSNGTSPAAAVTSGLFAMLFAADRSLDCAAAIARVQGSAADQGTPGWDPYSGWGRINAQATLVVGAINDVPNTIGGTPSVSILSPADGSLVSGLVPVDVRASDDKGIAQVILYVDGVPRSSTIAEPHAFIVDTSSLTAGQHWFSARATDGDGNLARSQNLRVFVTSGVGLLVRKAQIRRSRATVKAIFALPEGVTLNAGAEDLSVTLETADRALLAVTLPGGEFFRDARGKLSGDGIPSLPSGGSFKVKISPQKAAGVYVISLSVSGLGEAGPVSLMQMTLQIGAAKLSQSLGCRLKGRNLVCP